MSTQCRTLCRSGRAQSLVSQVAVTLTVWPGRNVVPAGSVVILRLPRGLPWWSEPQTEALGESAPATPEVDATTTDTVKLTAPTRDTIRLVPRRSARTNPVWPRSGRIEADDRLLMVSLLR